MDAARERVLARLTEVELLGNVLLGVDPFDLDAGIGEPVRVVGADDGRDGAVLGLRRTGHVVWRLERQSGQPRRSLHAWDRLEVRDRLEVPDVGARPPGGRIVTG